MPDDISNNSANNADDESRQDMTMLLSLVQGRRWGEMSKGQRTSQVNEWLDGYERGDLPTLADPDDDNVEKVEDNPTREEMTRLATHLSPKGQSELRRLSDLRNSLLKENEYMMLDVVKNRLRELMEQAAESAVEKASQNGVNDNGSVDTSQRNEQ